MVRIGIDLGGGTKIEIAALAQDGSILLRRRVPSSNIYENIITAIGDLVEGAEREIGTGTTIGIGTPGVGLARNRLIKKLQQRLPQRQAAAARPAATTRTSGPGIANDADCFALSEAIDGAAAGAQIVFGVNPRHRQWAAA